MKASKGKKIIYWICCKCGWEHGSPKFTASTFHKGKCDSCGKIKSVTQGRDYGVYEMEVK